MTSVRPSRPTVATSSLSTSRTGSCKVRLQGACAGCPMSQLTLTNGVERHLKNVVPGVERVENVGF